MLVKLYLVLRSSSVEKVSRGRWTLSPKNSEVGPFDKIFLAEGQGIPVPYLRALAKRESNNNPREQKGPAWGLLQVGVSPKAGDVLKGYNKRYGT